MRKLFLFLLLLLPLTLHSQAFKGFGLKINFTTSQYGWKNPDTAVSRFYKSSPDIKTLGFGLYGELFSKKNFSIMTNVYYRSREFIFKYDKYDVNMNKIGEADVKNSFSFISFALTPKAKLNYKKISFYVFGGPRFDFIFHKNIDKDFENIFFKSKDILYGLSLGLGTSINISKEFNLLLDFYFNPDINKTYNSPTGYIRNNELGIIFGGGIFNPKNR
ncbi:MAG: PorT family protein [Ignavibacteriae bacterium]|nr:MAG: PorT family protein [Ignavibacteriota bacterium]